MITSSQWIIFAAGAGLALFVVAALFLGQRVYHSYRAKGRRRHDPEALADLHLATVEALALAIDAKDRTSKNHISRVQLYAGAVAKAFGMSNDEIQGVKTAALLHDVGMLAVPEHILSKTGPLTEDEFQKIRIHPQVGADILSAVNFPYDVAPLILCHHERWDGKGYPQGLKGDAIPLGARILAVVDQFDALTSDRPYHRAMAHDAAIALLREEAGKALDPACVEMFLEMLGQLTVEAKRLESTSQRRASVLAENVRSSAVGHAEGARLTTVFDDIGHAHREIHALYELAQTMGTSLAVSDTMALLASKLSNLVPFTTCALFLYDADGETLRCGFATGAEAQTIGSAAIRTGQGLIGWVARNRQPLVNGMPAADFEAAGLPVPAGLNSALVAPLVSNNRFVATLAVYHAQPDFYTEDHRRLIDRVSEQASAVIHNAIIFEQTQEDSLTDALTALPNTRFMVMHLERELARAERLKGEVALLLLDLDNFKDINDNYGHQLGDQALRQVGEVLRGAIRPYDICVRYAGDEFIVVLSDVGRDEAEIKRLELQRAIDTFPFEPRPSQRIAIAVSVGAAVYPHDGNTYETLLATADSRMYRDKTRRKQQSALQSVAGTQERPSLTVVEPADGKSKHAGFRLR